MDLPAAVKKKILATYLTKRFWVPINPDRLALLKENYPYLASRYVTSGDSLYLRQVGAYHLTVFGHQNYRFLYSHEFVELYLEQGNSVDDDPPAPAFDTTTPFLIIYHPKDTMPNKQLENMVCHTISHRNIEGRTTLVLSEIVWPRVAALFNAVVDPTFAANPAPHALLPPPTSGEVC